MDLDNIKKYEPLWENWHVDGLIGQGSYGTVYRICREEWGYNYASALKVVNVPTKDQYREVAAILGNNREQMLSYFQDAVKSIISEIHLMYTLRGNSNIISYEDHAVEKSSEEIGWDILIRMELATPLNEFIASNEFSRGSVIQLGIDICSALDACSKKGIIHRDIKDENIFVSNEGTFKLGDFGIARVLTRSGCAASMKGTPLYMAPEVYKGEHYDNRADIYSLGIVLYKLLNFGRIPFLPPYPQEIKFKDSEAALEKRLSGEELPLPQQAPSELSAVILKACSFEQPKRYSSAADMKKELEDVFKQISEQERNEIIGIPKAKTSQDPSITSNLPVAENKAIIPDECTVSLQPAQNINDHAENDSIDSEKININSTMSLFGRTQNKVVEAPAISGNSAGNILNGGLAAVQGAWTYYSAPDGKTGLNKSNLDGENIKLSDDSPWFINVVDNWIFYSNASDEDKIYRIGTDGNERIKLNDDRSWDINATPNWIYYINESEGYHIYRIKPDGSSRMELNSDACSCLNLDGDWLYYSNKNDGGRIYRLRTDGSIKTRLNDSNSDCIISSNGWIYYRNRSNGHKLYKMKNDGSCSIPLSNYMSGNLNLAGEYIFYSNKSEEGRLYKVRLDGNENVKVIDENLDYVNIVNDWIFYCSKEDGNKPYRVKTNGSEKTVLLVSAKERPGVKRWFGL